MSFKNEGYGGYVVEMPGLPFKVYRTLEKCVADLLPELPAGRGDYTFEYQEIDEVSWEDHRVGFFIGISAGEHTPIVFNVFRANICER